jgi:hypothetical protein
MKIQFDWDAEKDRINRKKHSVSFEEAATVFFNFPLEVYFDPDHSEDEYRYIAIGYSNMQRCLLVVHCENQLGTKIRIISARKATRKEAKDVFGG